MIQKKNNGLNDSDKLLITVALWIATVAVFVTAITLPMLPNKVAIFYRPAEDAHTDYYSKYNNLLLILVSLIPVIIIFVTALLKRRNRLQNNFVSIILFSIMLSLSMGAIVIYGIGEQFDASSGVKTVNLHSIVTLIILFMLSIVAALIPTILHEPQLTDKLAGDNRPVWRAMRVLERFWNVGAYGFLLGAVACAFTPDFYCYVIMAAVVAAYAVFVAVCTAKDMGRVKPHVVEKSVESDPE